MNAFEKKRASFRRRYCCCCCYCYGLFSSRQIGGNDNYHVWGIELNAINVINMICSVHRINLYMPYVIAFKQPFKEFSLVQNIAIYEWMNECSLLKTHRNIWTRAQLLWLSTSTSRSTSTQKLMRMHIGNDGICCMQHDWTHCFIHHFHLLRVLCERASARARSLTDCVYYFFFLFILKLD